MGIQCAKQIELNSVFNSLHQLLYLSVTVIQGIYYRFLEQMEPAHTK